MNLDLDMIPVTEGISAAEDSWAGGVADLGDREAAMYVQAMPGYFDYRGSIEDEVRRQLGDEFFMYRAMTGDVYRAWESGEDMGPVGFTLSERLARGWKNLAAVERLVAGQELTIVRVPIRPEWIIMRGKPEESELVVDGNQVSFDTLEVI